MIWELSKYLNTKIRKRRFKGRESLGKITVNDAVKVDVFKLNEQKVEMNLKGQDGFDDYKVYKVVADDEDAQLDDLMATSADANSFDGPLVSISESKEKFNAKFLSKNEIEHNLGEESRHNKEMEEYENTFESKDSGLDYNFDVIGEAYHNNEEESPDENNEVTAEDSPYPTCSTCVVDTDGYSETTFDKSRMFSEVESKDVRLLFEGTFLKNSDEILKNLDKFPDAEVGTQLEVYDSVPENFEANLDIKNVLDEIGEGKKEDEATKDVKKGEDDFKLSKIAKNLKDKVGLTDANAHKAKVDDGNELLDDSKATTAKVNANEDSTATMSLPRIDLNADFVKEEVEQHSDETSDIFNGRCNDISDVVKLESENIQDLEYAAIFTYFERAFVEDDSNLNDDEKKEVVLSVTENDEDGVPAEESLVMKTVRIFKNKKYLRSKTFRIQGNDTRFDVKEIMKENPMNDDNKKTEDDGDDYFNVHGEILNASDEDLLESVPRDYKEEVCDDDEIIAKEVDHPIEL